MRELILFVLIKTLVIATLLCHQHTQGEVIYISPSPSCYIKSSFCRSVDELATNTSWFESNTTLIFLPGVHTLSIKFSIFNLGYLSLLTESPLEHNNSVVICQQNTGFYFDGITNVSVSGLKLFGCKCNIISVKQLSIEATTFHGENDSGTALEMAATNANISKSVFIFNRIGRCVVNNDQLITLVGGAIFAVQDSNITIDESRFEGNHAEIGGAIFASGCNLKIFNSNFINNQATVNANISTDYCSDSGITQTLNNGRFLLQKFVEQFYLSISLDEAGFGCGGAIALFQSTLVINQCFFGNNTSKHGSGGVLSAQDSCVVNINNCEIYNSHVERFGGALLVEINSYLIIDNCTIFNNSAYQGGVVDFDTHLTIKNSILSNNTAKVAGGVIHSYKNNHLNISSSRFINNKAKRGGVLSAIDSTVNIEGNTTLFMKNKATQGGAIYVSQNTILALSGGCIFSDSQAIAGGAIYAEESTLNIYNKVNVVSNVASAAGGGLYLYYSKLNCLEESTFKVLGNKANNSGGGVYAAISFITVYYNRDSPVGSSVLFVKNIAQLGGGIYLESSAQLRMFKSGAMPIHESRNTLHFDSNFADYGKAVYVNDETYFDVCSRGMYANGTMIAFTECFIQVLSPMVTSNHQYDLVSIEFTNSNQSQRVESGTIYGGLLDRCTLNHFAEVKTKYDHQDKYIDGVMYLKLISNLNDTSRITSAAVRLCFCSPVNDTPDCNYKPPQMNVMKGELFNISLVAVDQVNNTVENTIIYSSLSSQKSGLGFGQLAQKTMNMCTTLNFSISSPRDQEELILYAEGPCRNVSISQSRLSIAFKQCTCPKIGFQPKHNDSEGITCECECDSRLYPYFTDNNCNYQTGMLTRNGNFWIMYVNDSTASSGYVVYSHCPLDYCLANVPVNLNYFNGSDDSQCTKGRSGTLCGACQPGLSLSLGSSSCLRCSSEWYKTLPATLSIAFVVGIAIVGLLMAFNLTVAVGTLNGLIFYANILNINGGTIISLSTKVPSVFISWLNLEVGFDICFFEGMDTYWKTWLQLAFPSYIILLLLVIIIVSDCSIKFSQLLAKRNPVATLATLTLLSYTMFLRTSIAVLSFAKLKYPDGSYRWVWLHDGTVDYLRGKHIALFVAAVVILIVGITYTSLILFWPWLLHHQYKAVFRWTRSQKLHHFMAPYHAPYNINHRYWTGLLLLARIALYLVFTLNASNDPGVKLLAIVLLVSAVLSLKARVGRIYQSIIIDSIEVIYYLNATIFSSVQLYLLKAGDKEAIEMTAYISGGVIMILFLTTTLYHMYRECGAKYFKKCKQRMSSEQNLIFDENNASLTDYPPVNNIKVTPTLTVIERFERPTDYGTFEPLNANCNH